jgi:hypothetical protein
MSNGVENHDILTPAPNSTQKTLATRPLKQKSSINNLIKKPSLQAMSSRQGDHDSGLKKFPPSVSVRDGSSASSKASDLTAPACPKVNSSTTAPGPESKSRKSSAALREQIAKARAAKRAAGHATVHVEPVEEAQGATHDNHFEEDHIMSADPFNQRRGEAAKSKILQQRVEAARTSGRLSIAAMGLKKIPAEVMRMYDTDSSGRYDGTWAESVDLSRFVVADNELEVIEDEIFPDVEPSKLADDDESRGNIFGGLEMLDLHGNMLVSIPMGLRQLRLLTSLNLVSLPHSA